MCVCTLFALLSPMHTFSFYYCAAVVLSFFSNHSHFILCTCAIRPLFYSSVLCALFLCFITADTICVCVWAPGALLGIQTDTGKQLKYTWQRAFNLMKRERYSSTSTRLASTQLNSIGSRVYNKCWLKTTDRQTDHSNNKVMSNRRKIDHNNELSSLANEQRAWEWAYGINEIWQWTITPRAAKHEFPLIVCECVLVGLCLQLYIYS